MDTFSFGWGVTFNNILMDPYLVFLTESIPLFNQKVLRQTKNLHYFLTKFIRLACVHIIVMILWQYSRKLIVFTFSVWSIIDADLALGMLPT
jgi:hypothetical protein